MVTDSIEQHLPRYLTPAQQSELVAQLRDFEGRSYYTRLFPNEILQGDCWSRLQIFNFADGRRDFVKGIIFSNSCDVDPANRRDFPPKLVFAPLINLGAYETRLRSAGTLTDAQIDTKLDSIRKQQVTSIFFLPRGDALASDSIVILDDVHSVPLNSFLVDASRFKVVTLNQVGFYLFVLKLSIHFCRFQEGISRNDSDVGN